MTPSTTATTASTHSQAPVAMTLVAMARAVSAPSAANMPITTPDTAYTPGNRWA